MRYISFEDPSTRDAFPRWRAAFLAFCRKLAYAAWPGQRLLLKSPVHTGRVALLYTLFGGTARFVCVHRNPHEMFQSHHAALVSRYFRCCTALQTFDAADAQRYIVAYGLLLHRLFMRDAAELPPGRVTTVAFADVVRDPVATLENEVYKPLGMTVSPELRAKFAAHAAQISGFRRNSFPPATTAQKELVRRQWAEMFRDFGYKNC